MSVCAVINIEGLVEVTTESTCSEFVLMTGPELTAIQSQPLTQMLDLLTLLFSFDVEVFAIVESALILAFLTSHFAGRVVRWLGK